MSDAMRGFLRSLTADVVGGPVDLATAVANLGIAGAGYAGHKAGLIKEPFPLIEDAVGGSDWFAKNTPLQDTGSIPYASGRIAGALTPAFWAAAGKVRPQPKGQVNALFPGGSDELLLAHNTNKAPKGELYHTSAAVTRGAPLSSFGDISLVINPKSMDPRTTPTVVKNRDFYSPRWNSSVAGGRYSGRGWQQGYVDDAEFQADFAKKEAQSLLDPDAIAKKLREADDFSEEAARWQRELASHIRTQANSRLIDRFIPVFPGSGSNFEGTGLDFLPKEFPRVRQSRGFSPVAPRDVQSIHDEAIRSSPRFQSWKHFEKSPLGARLLQGPDSDPITQSGTTERVIAKVLMEMRNKSGGSAADDAGSYPQILKRIRQKPGDYEWYDTARDPLKNFSPEEVAGLLLGKVKRLPSNYAEAKRYGPMPFNKETIAGAAINRDSSDGDEAWKIMGKMGVPRVDKYEVKGRDLFDLMVDMQNQSLKRK